MCPTTQQPAASEAVVDGNPAGGLRTRHHGFLKGHGRFRLVCEILHLLAAGDVAVHSNPARRLRVGAVATDALEALIDGVHRGVELEVVCTAVKESPSGQAVEQNGRRAFRIGRRS